MARDCASASAGSHGYPSGQLTDGQNRIADEMGCIWGDIVMENRDLFFDDLEKLEL